MHIQVPQYYLQLNVPIEKQPLLWGLDHEPADRHKLKYTKLLPSQRRKLSTVPCTRCLNLLIINLLRGTVIFLSNMNSTSDPKSLAFSAMKRARRAAALRALSRSC
jgi:hypothetical protein